MVIEESEEGIWIKVTNGILEQKNQLRSGKEGRKEGKDKVN